LPLTLVQDSNLVSVAAWYDNEYGFTSRLAELTKLIADRA